MGDLVRFLRRGELLGQKREENKEDTGVRGVG